MKKIKFYLQRVYRLALSIKSQEDLVWEKLKKLHNVSGWNSGIYESEKYIESIFKISEESVLYFYYMIYDKHYHCDVKLLKNFPSDLTTDVFILAAHINNLLHSGVVKVNVDNQFVEYKLKSNLLLPLLYPGEIYIQMMGHYNTSKDIFNAFQRLVIEHEAPAIIIADLLNQNESDAGNFE